MHHPLKEMVVPTEKGTVGVKRWQKVSSPENYLLLSSTTHSGKTAVTDRDRERERERERERLIYNRGSYANIQELAILLIRLRVMRDGRIILT